MASVNEVPFFLDGSVLPFVDKCCHLGHMLSSCLDDKQDILSRIASMCGKVNNVLCYFNKCFPLVRFKLIRAYCSDLYSTGACCGICLIHPLIVFALLGARV